MPPARGGSSQLSPREIVRNVNDPALPDRQPSTRQIPSHFPLGGNPHALSFFIVTEVTLPRSQRVLPAEAAPATRRIDAHDFTGVVEAKLEGDRDAGVRQRGPGLVVVDRAPADARARKQRRGIPDGLCQVSMQGA